MQEARPKSHSEEVGVHLSQNFVLLATRTKVNVEQALSRFMEMASGEVSLVHIRKITCIEHYRVHVCREYQRTTTP